MKGSVTTNSEKTFSFARESMFFLRDEQPQETNHERE